MSARKEKGKDDTLAKVIRYDLAQTKRKRKARLRKASVAHALRTGDGRRAVVYSFSFEGADQDAAQEKVAYIDTPKAVVMLVLTAHARSDYARATTDFARLVASFHFISDDVQIRRGK